MKKALLIIAIILLAGLLTQFIRWRLARADEAEANFILPKIMVATLQLEQYDPEATRIAMKMRLENNAPIGLDIDSLSYILRIGDSVVFHSTYPHHADVPAYGTAIIVLPVTLHTERLVNTLKSMEARGLDSVTYSMDAVFRMPPFWKDKPAQVHVAKYLPLLHIPTMEQQHLTLERFGMGSSLLMVDLSVTNPNVFAMTFKETTVHMRIADDEVFRTRIDTAIHVPAQGTVVIRIPAEISPGELLEGLYGSIVKPAHIPYAYDLALTANTDNDMLRDSRVKVKGEGTLDELTQ